MLFDITLWPVLCTVLLLFTLMGLRIWKLERQFRQQGKLLAILNEDMKALLVCEKGMGQRIKQQQKQVKEMIDRQDKLEISDGSNASYKQAMILLQKGASTDELIDACDLSRGELELLSRLKIQALATNQHAIA